MQSISSFYLSNNAGFVCNTGCTFIDSNGNEGTDKGGGNIAVGQGEYYNPGDHGIGAGSVVKLYIDVHAGSDRTGSPFFNYDPTVNQSARYTITGTTLESSVTFNGVS